MLNFTITNFRKTSSLRIAATSLQAAKMIASKGPMSTYHMILIEENGDSHSHLAGAGGFWTKC